MTDWNLNTKTIYSGTNVTLYTMTECNLFIFILVSWDHS